MAEEDLNLNNLILEPKIVTTPLTTSQSRSLGSARSQRTRGKERHLVYSESALRGTPSPARLTLPGRSRKRVPGAFTL